MGRWFGLAVAVCITAFLGCDWMNPFSTSSEGFDKLIADVGYAHDPHLSPDGSVIAYLKMQENRSRRPTSAVFFDLWIIDQNGMYARPLISRELFSILRSVNSVIWCPDSKHLLVSVWIEDSNQIWTLSLDGTVQVMDFSHVGVYDWMFSADGRYIAYFTYDGGSDDTFLCVCDIDGGKSTTVETGWFTGYAWLSDSRGLVYSLYDADAENHDIWTVSVDSEEKIRVCQTDADERYPSYSFDGQYLVFTENDTIRVTLTDQFEPHAVPVPNSRYPVWIPRRHWLNVYSEQTDGTGRCWTESWIVDLNGAVIRKIAPGNFTQVDFHSDGKHYVYVNEGYLWMGAF